MEFNKTKEGPVKRSNRPLTHFACLAIDRFFSNQEKGTGEGTQGNTSYVISTTPKDRNISVFLYETELLNMVIDNDENVVHVAISVGDRFSHDGSPSQAVVERLNGILDTIGLHGAIPEGVRVFKDQVNKVTCIGKGEIKIPLGFRYARNVLIKPDEQDFEFLQDDSFLWKSA